MTTTANDPVLFEEINSANPEAKIAIATLNAPKAINSLSLDMASCLYEKLIEWQKDNSIVTILLRGSGDKGFCAGGDILQLRDSSVNEDDRAKAFFAQEYRLDYLIHTYTKPIIVWGHGIVMGGGLGLMAGASHRVATEKTRLAMPEVTIGLYPDVGGSYFLNRMPGSVGLFLAITGASINAKDTNYVGLADYLLKHEQWQQVVDDLTQQDWQVDEFEVVSRCLLKLESEVIGSNDFAESKVKENLEIINNLCKASTNDEIIDNIVSYSGNDEWLEKAAETLRNGCPTTIKLVFEQLKSTTHLSLKEIFQLELIISCNCMNFGNFAEGVRALLVDKDHNPQFTPSKLADVSDEFVLAHFQAPWVGDNPLSDL